MLTDNPKHQTSLLSHLKGYEFWLDTLFLFVLWSSTLIVPEELEIFSGAKIISIIKIVALLASLQIMGFFAYHLAGKRAGLIIQGFLGGFVSSTMTYLQFTQQEEFAHHNPWTVSRALILSTVAMLAECIFIILTLASHSTWPLILPVLIQLTILILIVLFLPASTGSKASSHKQLAVDKPIVWKKVIYFAALILFLIYSMRLVSQHLSLNYMISAFVMSLFESHGVLAAAMTEFNSHPSPHQGQIAVFVILLGNVLSKSFFVVRGKSKRIRKTVIGSLIGSLTLAASTVYLIN
jgi:uncharacterized membrane protein (DUF4010 family)